MKEVDIGSILSEIPEKLLVKKYSIHERCTSNRRLHVDHVACR